MTYVDLTARCVIGLVFLVAAISKVRTGASRMAYRAAVAGLLPAVRSAPQLRCVAVTVVGVELGVVALLLAEATVAAGYLLAATALGGFTVVLWAALRRGTQVSCRCFGQSDAPVSRSHLLRNAGLMLITAAGVVSHTLAPASTPHPAGVAVGIAAALVVTLVVLFTDDLAALLGPPSSPTPTPRADRTT